MTTNHNPNIDPYTKHDQHWSFIRDQFAAYVTAEVLEHRPDQSDPQVTAYLLVCEHCRDEMDELRHLTTTAYTDQFPLPDVYPQPDLAFLPKQPTAAAKPREPWRIDGLGRLIITFSQALLDTLRPPAFAGAARGQLLYMYAERHDTLPDINITVEVFAEDAAHEQGFVRVGVELLSRDPLDQAASHVALYADDTSWHGDTDASGSVAFEAVPLAILPRLTIEITSQGQTTT